MNYDDFLIRIIDDGIEAAKADYTKPEESHKLEGSLAGFELCRGQSPTELLSLFYDARSEVSRLLREQADLKTYWYAVCREAEIEWVCNCVGAMLVNQGIEPVAPVMARGAMKAAEVVGVRGA